MTPCFVISLQGSRVYEDIDTSCTGLNSGLGVKDGDHGERDHEAGLQRQQWARGHCGEAGTDLHRVGTEECLQ